MVQLSESTGMTSLAEPGLSPTRPSMTWFMTYDELLSSMSAESVREMSPGRATMSVPPALGVSSGAVVGAGVAAPGGAGGAGGGGGAPGGEGPPPRAPPTHSHPNPGRLIP